MRGLEAIGSMGGKAREATAALMKNSKISDHPLGEFAQAIAAGAKGLMVARSALQNILAEREHAWPRTCGAHRASHASVRALLYIALAGGASSGIVWKYGPQSQNPSLVESNREPEYGERFASRKNGSILKDMLIYGEVNKLTAGRFFQDESGLAINVDGDTLRCENKLEVPEEILRTLNLTDDPLALIVNIRKEENFIVLDFNLKMAGTTSCYIDASIIPQMAERVSAAKKIRAQTVEIPVEFHLSGGMLKLFGDSVKGSRTLTFRLEPPTVLAAVEKQE